jgi:hypothetical protein
MWTMRFVCWISKATRTKAHLPASTPTPTHIHKRVRARLRTHEHACTQPHAREHTEICNTDSDFANASQCYILRALTLLFDYQVIEYWLHVL